MGLSNKIKLKNFSTNIKAEKTIVEIERILAMFGADAIMKEMTSDGMVYSLAFKLNGKSYKLPINVEGVYTILFKRKPSNEKVNAEFNRVKRAYNVAWRILKDWVHSQLSLIASKQAEPEQVLLPYLFDGKRTLYEAYIQNLVQLKEPEEKELG